MKYEDTYISLDTIDQDNFFGLIEKKDYSSVSYLYCEYCIDSLCVGDILHSINAHNLNGLCDLHYDIHEDNASEECECCLTNTVSRVKNWRNNEFC